MSAQLRSSAHATKEPHYIITTEYTQNYSSLHIRSVLNPSPSSIHTPFPYFPLKSAPSLLSSQNLVNSVCVYTECAHTNKQIQQKNNTHQLRNIEIWLVSLFCCSQTAEKKSQKLKATCVCPGAQVIPSANTWPTPCFCL